MLLIGNTVESATLMDGIHGYWPLNDGSGTALLDFSQTQPAGELKQTGGGAPRGLGPAASMWVTDSVRGSVIGFTGNDADGYGILGPELLPVTDLTDGFTWSFWAKSDQANNNDIILGSRYNTNNVEFSMDVEGVPRQWVKFTGNQFEWRPNDVAGNLNYADFGVQTDWMHHVVTRDRDILRYYRNGVLTLTGTQLTTPITVPLPIYIGGQGRENWRGYLDEVLLFKRALSAAEVTKIYQLSHGKSLSDLLTPGPAKLATTIPANGATGAAFDTTITATIVEGTTKIDETKIEMIVNGQSVPVTVGARDNLSAEVSTVAITGAGPSFPNLYPAGSTVNATIRFTDTAGATSEQQISFTVQNYLTVPPAWSVPDVGSERGFLVRTHILNNRRHVFGDRGARIPPAERQLAGRIAANVANPAPFTRNGYFHEDMFINYNQAATGREDTFASEGMFGNFEEIVKVENAIPGMEGATLDPAGENAIAAVIGSDHTALEILTYLELPAGVVNLGVNSDDGFRLTISPIGAPADKFGVLVSEFDGGRGSSATQGTEMRIVVEQAGKYAFRLLWYEGQGGSNAEWYSVGSDGSRVLINDPAEPAAIKAYTSRTGPQPAHVNVVDPFPFGSNLDFAFPDDPIYVEITHGATAIALDSVSLKLNGVVRTPSKTQSGNKTVVELAPPGGVWPPGDLAVELTYSDGTPKTHSWTVPMIGYVSLEDCLRTEVGTGSNPGMRWLTHWISTGTRANSVEAAENQLANSPNAADLTGAVNGYFEIDNVNFQDVEEEADAGMFGETRPAPRNSPEVEFPGIPASAPADPNYVAGVALTYIEFPTAGMYYMGVNRDDGFRLTVATTEGGRSLTAGPDVQQVGVFNGGGGTDANNVQANGFMAVHVPKAGVWPFRLLYWGGTGDDNLEWFQTNEQLPIGLVNDELTTSTLRAFRTRTVQAPAQCGLPTLTATRTGTGLSLEFTGTLQVASEVDGPYADLTVTSPHQVTTSETHRFYRAAR